MDQFRGELARMAAALGDRSEAQADDADIDAHRAFRQALLFARPVMPFHRRLEAVRDLDRFGAAGQVGNQKAELVAAESGVQVARSARALHRKKVFGADLIRQDVRYAFDDPVAHGVTERVVVPLETADIDDTDAAPADALLDGE